ncbi:hypothetical protein RFI_35938 [Reticulomyxa filosa]|uniref:Uncharacterized protein n=1 Tax=Reticulomyxa filosa TaxID=46433 RepID=X6LK42_RETFI|nr:hypothetical protein RFI_38882 [Reticulomyxa filosa]ETO01502.1 hypothetical protein RFI_35938 [Reticulomyxa filosa]|eukprot:ETN98611.1 hypothetical protein RFI_38882 [Reticulomyxa filosa]
MAESKDQDPKQELYAHLKDVLKIKSEDALNIAAYLYQLGVTERDDMIYMESEQWTELFEHVKVAPISKSKVLKKIEEMRKNTSNIPSTCPNQMYLSIFFVLFLFCISLTDIIGTDMNTQRF